jgi:hypothetical protein
VVGLLGSEGKTSADILLLQIRKIGEDLGLADTGSQQIENILHSDAHAADAWATAALIRVERDAIHNSGT